MALPVILLGACISPSLAFVGCVPCDGCWIQSEGQMVLTIMDREEGLVRMIPNIRFTWGAATFALIVPTPSLPELDLAPASLWWNATDMTRSTYSKRDWGSGGLGCSENAWDTQAGYATEDEIIYSQQTIGNLEATILSSDNPDTLVAWLRDNGFELSHSDAEKFAPYVERGWFFTVLRPDTTQPGYEPPDWRWDANIAPIAFTYSADSFELPLPILAINRAWSFPVAVFVVDDHRMNLQGFQTLYANRITEDEYAAIGVTYPSLAAFLAPGRFFTRLDRTFSANDPMSEPLLLGPASNDDEFRRHGGVYWGGIPIAWILVAALPVKQWIQRRRRRLI